MENLILEFFYLLLIFEVDFSVTDGNGFDSRYTEGCIPAIS